MKREQLISFVKGAAWFPLVVSGCMCVYVVGASRQGLGWFSPQHNPYLILQLAGAGVAFFFFNERPPRLALLLAGAAWGAYAAVITRQRWHFKEWRYIGWAHLPLAALAAAYVAV